MTRADTEATLTAKLEAGDNARWNRAGDATAWVRLFVAVAARAYLAMLTTLAAATVLPVAWGWASHVELSRSMMPAIQPGDVVVASPLGRSETLPIGRVMLFINPAKPDLRETLIHRIVARRADGTFTTAGDANPANDATSVPRELFSARARLRVPFVGLPWYWAHEHEYLAVVTWAWVTAVALLGAISEPPQRRDRTPRPCTAPATGSDDIQQVTHRAAKGAALAAAVASVAFFVIAAPAPAAGAPTSKFNATTGNAGDTWTASTILLQPYTAAVVADTPYLFYPLDESAGSVAGDSSGNNRNGTYTAIASYRQPGALPDDFGYSVSLEGGGGRIVSGGSALPNPTTFTLELWFKTTSTAGGKLIGFESTQSATSPSYDRHIFMDASGHIVYGGWPNGPTEEITSPRTYNDGRWHYLALTAIPASGGQQTSTLYIDGTSVASGTTTKTSSYSGWWRVGYGKLPPGPGYPTNANFVGNIDELAVYQTALSSNRITAHYASR